jgi:hypothetical protein
VSAFATPREQERNQYWSRFDDIDRLLQDDDSDSDMDYKDSEHEEDEEMLEVQVEPVVIEKPKPVIAPLNIPQQT